MFRTLAIAALLLAPFSPASAQDTYPSRPITMIVPFPPGGVADLTGRPIAAAMQKALKQPVVVINRTGAGGALGMSVAAKAAPDGYTLLMGLSSISIFPVSDRINGKAPAYEMSDFAPIALVSADPTVLMVRADSPYRTAQDFIAAAKAHPGKLAYASSGVYGTLHVAMEMLAHAAGIQLFHVPYGGAGPAVAALLGDQVQALASGPSAAIGQIRAGKMRALASWGDKRLASLPEVPTFKELGLDAQFYIWSGLFAPAATPAPIVTRLREAVRQSVEDPGFRAAMDKLETPVAYLDAPQFAKFWERDAARLKTALEKIGRVDEK